MMTKKLTLRQVRWMEFLSEFNFVISYQSGKKNDKVDELTQKPNKRPTEDKDKWHQYSVCVLLLLNQINHKAELQPIEKNHADRIDSETNSSASDETSPLPEWVMEFNRNNELSAKSVHTLLIQKG